MKYLTIVAGISAVGKATYLEKMRQVFGDDCAFGPWYRPVSELATFKGDMAFFQWQAEPNSIDQFREIERNKMVLLLHPKSYESWALRLAEKHPHEHPEEVWATWNGVISRELFVDVERNGISLASMRV